MLDAESGGGGADVAAVYLRAVGSHAVVLTTAVGELSALPRPLVQHRIKRVLDGANIRILVRKILVAGVHQHRGIGFEHDEISVAVERAIDAEIIEPDAL